MNKNKQKGVGLMEVLVALLILSIGILGFTALQIRAVAATDEAFNRVQAMNLARDLAERIRANRTAITTYQSNLNTATQVDETALAANSKCLATTTCTNIQMANYDSAQIVSRAKVIGLSIKMPVCPGITNSTRACIYVAWNKTTPTDTTITSATACTKNGVYQSNSQCIVLEAY